MILVKLEPHESLYRLQRLTGENAPYLIGWGQASDARRIGFVIQE
jgi:hypothetical protein